MTDKATSSGSSQGSSQSNSQNSDPLKATRELVRQIDSNPAMRAAVAKALKAMEWQPGDKLPPA
jgi:hypothetical protein